MSLITHIPFTYRIKNITTDLQYYGVRFANNCHPDDLWTKYFTSSKAVHLLIEQHGADDFTIRITRQFPNAPDKAIDWEGRIVKRILYDPKWLNMNWRGSIHPDAAIIGGLRGSAKTNGGFSTLMVQISKNLCQVKNRRIGYNIENHTEMIMLAPLR